MSEEELQSEQPDAQDLKYEIAKYVRRIMGLLRIPIDDSTIDTPDRVAKMYYDEIFSGLKDSPPRIMTQDNVMDYDQMIVQKNITVKSTCEHHLVPIMGYCHIAYIPKKKLIGLSKMNRVVEYYSRRPQVQEKLTDQILNHLTDVLDTEDVAVIIDAEHFCIKMRGVEHGDSITRTSKLSGVFRTVPEARGELYAGI